MSSLGPLQVVALAAVFMSRALSCGLLAPSIPEVAREFGVSYDQIGTFIALLFVGYTATVVLAGRLADQFGRRPLLLFGAVLNGLCTAAIAFVPGTAFLQVDLFLLGVAGIGDMTATVLLAESGGASNSRVLSYGHAGFAVGAVVAPLVAGAALSAGIGYRTLFLGMSGVNALVVLGIALARIPEPPHAHKPSGQYRGLLKTLHVPLGLATGFLYIAAETGTVMWLPTVLLDRHGASPAVGGAAVSAFWVLMAVGRIGFARPLDRVRDRMGLIAALFLAGAASYGAGLLAGSLGLAFAGMALTGLFYSFTYPLLQSRMTMDHPYAAASVISLLATGAGLSGSASQKVVGMLADRLGDGTPGSGLQAALWLVPAWLVAAAGAAMLYRRVRRE